MKSFESWLENKLWLEDKKMVKDTILGLLDFLGDSEKDRLNFHVNNIDSDTKRKIKPRPSRLKLKEIFGIISNTFKLCSR